MNLSVSARAKHSLLAWLRTASWNRLPSETLKSLADFIEYTDTTSVEVIESTVAWIQILDARMRSIVQDNNDPSGTHVVVRAGIEGRIIDAATIYAGAASAFDYARRRRADLPATLLWDAVLGALRNMRIWDHEYPRLYQIIEGRQSNSSGPFERLARDEWVAKNDL